MPAGTDHPHVYDQRAGMLCLKCTLRSRGSDERLLASTTTSVVGVPCARMGQMCPEGPVTIGGR